MLRNHYHQKIYPRLNVSTSKVKPVYSLPSLVEIAVSRLCSGGVLQFALLSKIESPNWIVDESFCPENVIKHIDYHNKANFFFFDCVLIFRFHKYITFLNGSMFNLKNELYNNAGLSSR